MNYDWLFSLCVFAEHLNFTRAAEELHITQPALHAQIRKLAQDVGVPLYRRKGRQLVLTAEGRRLAAFGREVRSRGSDVLAEVRGEGDIGPVVLASGQGAFLYLLGDAIRAFPKDRWPLRLLAMSGPETLDAVRDARADIGVAVLESPPDDLTTRRLRRVGQQVVVPHTHRLAGRTEVAPEDLDGEALVVAPRGSPHRTLIGHALAAADARWTVAVEATGWELMLRFTRYGLGITVINDFCPVPSGFVGLPLSWVPAVSYYRFTRPHPAGEARETLVKLIEETV